MRGNGWARAFAIIVVAVLSITLVVNSINSSNLNVTGNYVKIIEADPSCGVNGYKGDIVISAEEETFFSDYKTELQNKAIAWVNTRIDDCNEAIESFGGYCGTMSGNCRYEKGCKVEDNRVGFSCSTDLPIACNYGDGRVDCKIEATSIDLGTCTCVD